LIAKSLVEYGKKNQLDPKFAAALIARESAFNNKAISSTGAKGLGQIKDFNYKSLRISDPFDIKQNARGTTKYIKRMLSIWKGKSDNISLALASYYKGHGAVKKDNGKLDKTTSAYVKDIMNNYKKIVNIREKKESRIWR
jgi:Soluble lytic murein transglycosylase and related regulatory proteins (some contain LysM/invasin domains)